MPRGPETTAEEQPPSLPSVPASGAAPPSTVGVAPAFRPGLDCCVKKVLRLGIVLVGLRLSLLDLGRAGAAAVPAVVLCVAAGILVSLFLARRLGVSPRLGLLAAASTAICGVTAALAVAPVVDAEEREVAYTVGCVTLYGLLGMLLYPLAAHALYIAINAYWFFFNKGSIKFGGLL